MSEPVEICDPANPQDALNKIRHLATIGHKQMLASPEDALLSSTKAMNQTVDGIEGAINELFYELWTLPYQPPFAQKARIQDGIRLLRSQINGD